MINPQMKFGEVSIADIQFDLRSRDEIPKLLLGLQQIYCNREIRKAVFEIMEEIIPEDTDSDNGRPGWIYGKYLYWVLSDNHRTLRQMLGHGITDQNYDINESSRPAELSKQELFVQAVNKNIFLDLLIRIIYRHLILFSPLPVPT